jgi:hypothetical protein
MPLFSTPLALFGLLALPALAAIYYLHTRSRLYPVSSLLLWVDARVAPMGGRKIERLRLPLAFWLELVVLALLALAAAGTHLPAGAGAHPLVVVLDDSFSMRAGEPGSARKRAAEALLEDLRRTPRRSVRFVLAGDRPQVLGEAVAHTSEAERLLEGWTCQARTARLDAAVTLALELGGESASVLVLTDHAPDPPPNAGRVRWWSFGVAGPNWAIVNANRTAGPHGDRLLLEVANLAAEPRATTLHLETGQPPREMQRSELNLGAGETHRLVVEVPDGLGPVRAFVGDDQLNFDNAVTLLPAVRGSVTYELRVGDRVVRAALEQALKATRRAVATETQPQLVFVEGPAQVRDGDETWVVRLLREPEAEAFTGPFVLDRTHPLTDGVPLPGVIWGGGKTPLPGAPVVMAGNVALVTDSESVGGRHEVRLRLRPDISNLLRAPAWPALVWNLVHWRAAFRPGLERSNVRLGEEAVWMLAASPASVEVVRPGGEVVTVPVNGRRAVVRAEQVGIYSLRAGAEKVEFAASALNRDESDLTKCATGRWGDEPAGALIRGEYRDVTAWLVLLALAVAALHVWVLARRPAAGATP